MADVIVGEWEEEGSSGVDCSTPTFHVRVQQLQLGGGSGSAVRTRRDGRVLREIGVQTEHGLYDFRVDMDVFFRLFHPKSSIV